MFWINNIYPYAYDDKCLPWTWFVPCYIQLSLLVPPIVGLYKFFDNKCIAGLIFTAIAVVVLAAQFIFVYQSNVGGTMVMNDEFFAKVFMNPLSHLFTFLFGIYMSLVYTRYRKERGYASAIANSFSSRSMEMIRHNVGPRYILYLVAMTLMVTAILWQTPFVSETKTQSTVLNAFYATFSFPLFIFGLSMLIMPALAGKAAAFRFCFCSSTFTPMSHSSIGMYYTTPMIAIFYFMST